MKSSLFSKILKRNKERVIEVDYNKTQLFYRKSLFMETLSKFVFDISKKYGRRYINFISIKNDSELLKDNRCYDTLNLLVEIKVLNEDVFVRFDLHITPFDCCAELDSYKYDDVDVQKYFDLHKNELERKLTFGLKKVMKETFKQRYVHMYKKYRKEILENDILQIEIKRTRECESLERSYNDDIERVKSM